MSLRYALALTGMTSHSKALDVIGNNIANNGTVGFKASRTRFNDIMATANQKWGPTRAPNEGASSATIRPQLTQGEVTGSSNPLDMAIMGMGFLRMEKDGEMTYTRDGEFQLGEDAPGGTTRTLVDRGGRHVTGYAASYVSDPQGTIVPASSPTAIIIDTTMAGRETSNAALSVNLDTRQDVPVTAAFNLADPSSYNHTAAVAVYDDLGNKHDLQFFFVKTAVPQSWQVYSAVDGQSQRGPETLSFAADGTLSAASAALNTRSYVLADGTRLSGITPSLAGSTQYGGPFTKMAATQDGYPTGFADTEDSFTVEQDGVIWGNYSNGQARRVGQVVLANFVNSSAMLSVGDGQWIPDRDPLMGAGKELIGVPGDRPASSPASNSGMGFLKGGAKELSNVNLNDELVALIEQQRNYQANAQTFKSIDQALQALSQIR